MSILLIGTTHQDPQKKKRLWKLFDIEKPDLITIEAIDSDEQLFRRIIELRKQVLATLRTKGLTDRAFRVIEHLIDNDFQESLAAIDYGRTNEKTVIPIDDPANHSRKKPKEYLEALTGPSPEDLSDICTIEQLIGRQSHDEAILDEALRGNRNLIHQVIRHHPTHTFMNPDGSHRDDFPARKLRKLVTEFKGHIIHIAGTAHIVDDPKGRTLFSKIKDLHPARKQLCEYDD